MAIVNIRVFSSIVVFFLAFEFFATASWIPEKVFPHHIKPRALPYQSLKSDLAITTTNIFPSRTPKPSETVGDYLDVAVEDISGNGSSESANDKRHLVRTGTLLESVWLDGQTHYNVSIMRCITFETIAGPWTLANGTTTENATLLDINLDLQAGAGDDPEAEYGARVLSNAKSLLNEAEQNLHGAVCDYDYTADPMNDGIHDELRRKLLGVDGYWIATVYKSITSGAVAAGVYAGFFNPHNHTTSQVVAAGMAGVGVTFVIGVVDRLQLQGRLTATEATILSVFISWYNQAMHAMSSGQIGPDNAVSGQNPCISKEVVEQAIKTMAGIYDVETGFSSGDLQLDSLLQCG